MEILKRVHAHNLVRWAQSRPRVVVLSGDLTSSTEADLFHEAYPDRFFSMGMAEQNMLSFAGGLAREGFIPFVHTFAVFIYRRAYDQLSMSIAYPNLKVALFGFLPGITTPGGVTHQAIEDLAVMRAVPNMTVLECGDATDVETVLDVVEGVPGPVYVRMLRGEIPRLFPKSAPMHLGQARVLNQGADLTLLSAGICTEEAMRATQVLKNRGVSIHHLHISTFKPFNETSVIEAVAQARYGVITMENHSVLGGLGTAVAEAMAGAGIGKKLVRIGLRDTYAHGASRPHLMKEYELDALSLCDRVAELLDTTFDIEEGDLAAIRLSPTHGEAKAEAL